VTTPSLGTPAAEAGASIRLSPGQRAPWELLHAAGVELRTVFGCDLGADVEPWRVEQALARLIARHEALRLWYPAEGGPVVAAPWAPRLVLHTLREPAEDALGELYRTLQAGAPEVDVGPVLRATLAHAPGRVHVAIAAPALNVDARSARVLLRELVEHVTGTAGARSEPAVGFRDLVEWLGAPTPQPAQAFWTQHGASVPDELDLPLDRDREPPLGFCNARLNWDIEALLGRPAPDAEGTRHIWSCLLAAAAAWASRVSGTQRVPLAVVFDGRDYDELEDAVGPFARQLPLTIDVGPTTAWADLEAVAGDALDRLRQWQEWFRPVGRAVEDVRRSWRGSGPLCVEVRRVSRPEAMSSSAATVLAAPDRHALRLVCELGPGGLRGALEYDAARVSEAAARCVREQLGAWLVRGLEQPGERVAHGALALPDVDDVVGDVPERVVPISRLFERQVQLGRDAIACVDGDVHVSYACLERLAEVWARQLVERAAELRPEARVAVRLRTSIEALAAMLAVMKTGAAYVPIDPAWPLARQAEVLHDAAAVAVMLAAHDRAPLPLALPTCPCPPPARPRGRAFTAVPAFGDGLAYVLYTSGTSGTPKGVMVTHAGLANYVTWAAEAYEIASSRGVLVQSALGFDFTLTGLLGPLIAGRTVYFCAGARPLDELAAALSRLDELALVKLTPTAVDPLRRLLDLQAASARVRRLVLGGEALFGSKPLAALARRLGATIVNEYGPTETVVGSSVYELDARVEPSAGPIPIGRAIANTTLHVTRDDGARAETWAEGELSIGGWGLARGYLGRPALTAALFVPHVGAGAVGARVYRSGDRVRRRADGQLVYLGRRDAQVKIRGFRVELSEIEEALRAHPAVAEAAAGVSASAHGHQALVACVVPEVGQALSPADLRLHLRSRLPEHAQPSVLRVLSVLPTTPNGKLDTEALLTVENAPDSASKTAPRSDVERTLHRLWRELLGRDDVGVDENFFEIGGDSILSIQFLARAHQEGLHLRPRDLERQPTISGLAALARRAEQAPAAGRDRGAEQLPLAPIQAWFMGLGLEVPQHHNQSVLLRREGLVSTPVVERAFDTLIAHHSALRHRFEGAGAASRQVPQGRLERAFLTSIEASGLDDEAWRTRLATAAEAAQQGLDLARGPLLRVVLLTRAERDETWLYLVIHHLVVDHLSWPILLTDLRAALAAPAAALPPATSYGEWVQREQERAARGLSVAERDYWLSERWASIPCVDTFHGCVADEDSITIAFEPEESLRLVGPAHSAYHTRTLDLLLTAWALAWFDWTGARTLAVDLETHGREDGDISGTVGWFTALYPVYLALTRPSDVGRAVREVKEALRAVPGDGAGYGRARHVGADPEVRRALARIQPAVAFNWLGDVDALAGETRDTGSWSLVPQLPAPNRSPRNRRTHALEVGAHVRAGCLRVSIGFAPPQHERVALEHLARAYARRLREVLAHNLAAARPGFTPSDFPLSGLDQESLDALLSATPALEDVYGLTHTQVGLLFHATRPATARSYVVQLRLAIAGALDVAAFEAAWARVTARHAILRTSFAWEAAALPVQVVQRDVHLDFTQADWRSLASESQRQRLDEWIAADRARGLDLRRAPLHRLGLLRLGDERFEAVWTYHHILLDGWSTSNVLREVLSLYAASRTGALPTLPRAWPYRDYVEWLHAHPAADALEVWREALQGVTSGTLLALEPPSEDADRTGFAAVMLTLSAAESELVEALARTARVTPNVVVQAAWALVLSRHACRDDVVFGVTSAGRPFDLPGVEERIGLYLNTLPARVQVSSRETVAELLARVNAGLRQLLQHDHVALADVQACCRLPEGEALFETLLVFENFPAVRDLGPLEGALAVRVLPSTEETNYPLTLIVGGLDRALSFKIAYDPGRFRPRAMQLMLEALRATLLDMARTPGGRAIDCGQAPVDRLPAPFAAGLEPQRPLHRMFEACAARTPHAIAVVDGSGHVSYAALERRAEAVAARLVEAGVRPGERVLLASERSSNLIAALLGILKAGATYVPVDARSPAKRIAVIAASCPFAVVDATTARAIPEGCRTLHLDAPDTFAQTRVRRPALPDDLDQVAYLMHTSGSSGTPKGTLITHRNVARLFATTLGLYDFARGGVWSFFHSIAFDFSVWELFGALLTGGRLVVVPYWVSRTPEHFADLLRREGVTVLSQTPSAFQQLLAAGGLLDPGQSTALRWVVFGGEAFRMRSIRAFRAELERRDVQLVNMYGITETTVHVTHRLMADGPAEDGRSLIGVALPDLTLDLLDRRLQAVPDGVAGEICVGGAGVAAGYADAARQTAQRFVPDPCATAAPGARLYRSGDLGRRLVDGGVEYLGRGDSQVKIRGFRTEPEEVRQHVSRQPGVRDAVVRAVADAVGDLVLAAYVVPEQPDFDVVGMQRALRDELPDHLVPQAVFALPAFPLTPNRKVDLAALPAPGGVPSAGLGALAAQTWEQELAADAWRTVLGAHDVGLHDNFFNLGGDSIKALRLVARLRRLGFEVTTEAVFVNPTVAELSRALAPAPEVGATESESGRPGLDQTLLARWPDAVDAYPATLLQLGMLFHAAQAEGQAPYHNVSATFLRGAFDERRLRAALAHVLERHPTLRTAFDLEAAGGPMQIVLARVPVPLTVERLAHLDPAARQARVERWMEAEKTRYFDVRQAPLVRFHVLVLDPETFALGVTEHHAILDGWSVATLLAELCRLYVQERSAADDSTAEGLDAPRHHALLERAALADPRQREFWRVGGAEHEPLRLPARWGSAPHGADGVRHRRVRLEAALVGRLRALAHDIPVPFKTVLLGVHLAVLAHIAGTERPTTGLISHARPETEGAERALGLFLNTLPFGLTLAGHDWTAWLVATYREEVRLLPCRRFPLAAMRDASGAPLELQVAFNYTNFHVYDQIRRQAPIEVLDVLAHESTNFELLADFSIVGSAGDLDLTLAYRPSRFGDEQVEGFVECYRRALAHLTREPRAPVVAADLSPVGEVEVVSGSASAAPSPWSDVRALIEASFAAGTHDRIAVVDGERHLSFAGLARETRRLSARLRALVLDDEEAVPVILDKSLEWLIALLGVVHAGAVYVPIDPRDPPERVRALLDGLETRLLIAHQTQAVGESALTRVSLALPQAESPAAATARRVTPQSLAYVLHTSGSTGRPKGVAMHHAGLVNLLDWQRRGLPLHRPRVLQYASSAFDVSIQEVLTALSTAGTLVLVPDAQRRDFLAVGQLMAREQVECLFAPDTVIKALWLAREPDPALRVVVSAGEPLAMDEGLRHFVRGGGQVHNHYGPTETHVVTAARISDDASSPSAPIGQPIQHTEVLLLDPWLRSLPPGAVGEASIGSPNVARGYHRAPKLTAERFVPHPRPAAGHAGERVYRTGDLVWREQAGVLRFRGRRDQQVKLRGHRIELDEVRQALLRHPDVAHAAVALVGAGTTRALQAYVVLRAPLEDEALRAFAGRTLPAFMVPARIVRVASIPMTRNGKLDLGALAAQAAPEPARARLEPRSELEQELLAAWTEVLGHADFAVGADFLASGGSSITLLQLQLKLRARLGVDVSLAQLAIDSSFEGMARRLEALLAG
jgi:amino acid adenylation domain-containing protein/non-ribosomal peptide synthase protein (TIGR01720 family)